MVFMCLFMEQYRRIADSMYTPYSELAESDG
jgi:hypothetical protein